MRLQRAGGLSEMSKRLLLLHYKYTPKDTDAARRNDFAYETWKNLLRTDPDLIMVDVGPFKRDSSSVGCSRRTAFVKDLFDEGSRLARLHDADVLYINNDVAVVSSTTAAVREQLRRYPCCCGQRKDVPKFSAVLQDRHLQSQISNGGTDLFAFTSDWWDSVRGKFPDVLLGTEGWDFVMKCYIRSSGFTKMPVVVYHENHCSFWKRPENLTKSPAQVHNRKLCIEWAKQNGYVHCLRDPKSGFLFDDKKSKPVIVQLSRYGDIISAIPMARELSRQHGDPVDWVVHRDFVDVLGGCSYIRPTFIGNCDCQDLNKGIEFAKRVFPGRHLLITQVNQNPIPIGKTDNFIVEQWIRGGFLHKFHDLPLVFDKRDTGHERDILNLYWPNGKEPVMLVNVAGWSSPYPYGQELLNWLRKEFSGVYTLLDISTLRLPRFLDLLPIIENAAVLVSIDSAPVHLAYATMTPTIVLSRDEIWYRSEPREHWIAHVSYSDSTTEKGMRTMAEALRWDPSTKMDTLVRKLGA